jgi:lipoprotein-anchoring transpeptidase ErfK/SrfK
MQKKSVLIAAVVIIIAAVVFIGYRLAGSGKTVTSASEGMALNKGNVSKEENELFALAARCEKSGDFLTARYTYRKIIEKSSGPDSAQKAQEGLDRVNIEILFSPVLTSDSIIYEVQKGDTLAKIAKKFSTTQGLIMKANNLMNAEVVPLGKKLKVHNEKVSIVVDKSQNILMLKSGDKILKTYRVATGANNSTPVGTFKVINKIMNPPWYTAGTVIKPDSPKNILGSRWFGLSVQGYGIHGTTEPQSLGKQVTAGCVRMKNSDVEELYEIVPEGAEVVILD